MPSDFCLFFENVSQHNIFHVSIKVLMVLLNTMLLNSYIS